MSDIDDNVTGAFVRIKRDDRWQAIDIATMTEEELIQLSEDQPARGWIWAIFLASWVRDNVKQAPE